MGAAPGAGQYLTDGVSLIYVDAVLDDPDLADKEGRRRTVFLVEVNSQKGNEVKQMSRAEVMELKPVERG